MTSPLELSVVIPTYNERANIKPLTERLSGVLSDVHWEVVFVDDDSPDNTADEIRALAQRDPRIRCLHRVGRRGLSSACIEGLASCTAPFLAVMDADLQHDESLLTQMLSSLRPGTLDLVIGSRYVQGGGVGEWSGIRKNISRAATLLGRRVLRCEVADPMSGFFMVRRDAFWKAARFLSGRGFKILLDLIASSPAPLRILELPFTFRPRLAGESKLDSQVAFEYFLLLADKLIGWLVPLRFVLFVLVGSGGAILHLAILGSLHIAAGYGFAISQAIASLSAMALNFTINNSITYKDRRLNGASFWSGLFVFVVICSIGAFSNVQIARFLFQNHIPWWAAGLLGAMIGAVWNYGVSSQFVWRQKKRRPSRFP